MVRQKNAASLDSISTCPITT